MKSIKIRASGSYIPDKKIENQTINQKLNLSSDWIEKRTGIKQRHYAEEDITEIAIKAVENLIQKSAVNIQEVEQIYVATTSSKHMMPGISFDIQRKFNIKQCICLDILGGCSGYINALDIAQKYITSGARKNALIIGVDKLSEFTDEQDINTVILLGDGAGAIYIEGTDEEKAYFSNIESIGEGNDILKCDVGNKIIMDGKKIYKFATSKTVQNIETIIQKAGMDLDKIDYIVPHQSNIRILDSICNKLGVSKDKMFINLENIGNTFNASIPISLDEMFNKKLLKEGQLILQLGYGGGLNLGSIILEI